MVEGWGGGDKGYDLSVEELDEEGREGCAFCGCGDSGVGGCSGDVLESASEDWDVDC